MLEIAKESLAPHHYETLRQAHRANTEGLIPEIVFSLFLCGGIRKRIGLEEIAAQATMTYPSDFHTWVNGERIPDLAVMLLALSEASVVSQKFLYND